MDWQELSLFSWEDIENRLDEMIDSILTSVQRSILGESVGGCKTAAVALRKVLEEVTTVYSWDRPALHSPIKKGREADNKMGNTVVVITKLPESIAELELFLGPGVRKMRISVKDIIDSFTSKRIISHFCGELSISLHILDTAGEGVDGEKGEVLKLFSKTLQEMRGAVVPLSSLSTMFSTKLGADSQCNTLMCTSRAVEMIPSSVVVQSYISRNMLKKNVVHGVVNLGGNVLSFESLECGVDLSELGSRGFIHTTFFKPGQQWRESFSAWSDKSPAFNAVLLYLKHSGQCLIMERKDKSIVVMFYQNETTAFCCIMPKVESHFYHLLLSIDYDTDSIALTNEIHSLLTDINKMQLSPTKKPLVKTKPVNDGFDISLLESWRIPDIAAPQFSSTLEIARASKMSQNSFYHNLMLGVRESYTSNVGGNIVAGGMDFDKSVVVGNGSKMSNRSMGVRSNLWGSSVTKALKIKHEEHHGGRIEYKKDTISRGPTGPPEVQTCLVRPAPLIEAQFESEHAPVKIDPLLEGVFVGGPAAVKTKHMLEGEFRGEQTPVKPAHILEVQLQIGQAPATGLEDVHGGGHAPVRSDPIHEGTHADGLAPVRSDCKHEGTCGGGHAPVMSDFIHEGTHGGGLALSDSLAMGLPEGGHALHVNQSIPRTQPPAPNTIQMSPNLENLPSAKQCNYSNNEVADPFIFTSDDQSLSIYRPLKRKCSQISSSSNKRLEHIFDEVNKGLNLDTSGDENLSNKKLKTILESVLSECDVNNCKKFEMREPEIQLAQCLHCYYTTSDFPDFFNVELHPCICEYESMQCETCKDMTNNANILNMHALKHRNSITFLQPVKVRPDCLICSADCPTKTCSKTSRQIVTNIKKMLRPMKKLKLHNFLLSRLQAQKSLGLDSCHSIVFQTHVFCHSGATNLLGISSYLIKKVFNEHLSGIINAPHGNLGNVYLCEKRDRAIAFISHFAQRHSENLPDKQVLRLPSYLNVKEIFINYKESVPTKSQLKERGFYMVFKKYFSDVARPPIGLSRVTFMPRHSHPICNECDQINTLKKVAKNENEVLYANERKRTHMNEMKEKYVQFCERRELAVLFPLDYLHINLDDIDQVKMKSPHAVQNTKETSGMLKLDNHCTGIIATNGKFVGDRCIFAYLNNNQYPQDSNKTVSIIFDVLLTVKEKLGGSLPRKMMVQSDNCSRDLKNQFVLAFYWVLVDHGIFQEVTVSHMDVGHTHGDVDQIFSVFASRLRKLELPSFESLLSELKKITIDSQHIHVKEFVFTTDFTKHISKYLQPISGHTAFFQFKIRKENSKTKMFVKQDVLEKVWQFTSGIWLLKSQPSMKNLSVSAFRSESDYGEIFKSIWNKYIPSLTLKYPEEEVIRIKEAWEKRITYLIQLKESQFEAFDLFELVSDIEGDGQFNNLLNRVNKLAARKEATLTATFYPPEIKSFSVDSLVKDCSIVFYTLIKTTRPWIGLFITFTEEINAKKIKVEWLRKERNYYVLDTKSDGSPYYSVLDIDTVMFSNVLRNVSGKRKGPYQLDHETKKEIMKSYCERDSNLK